MKKEEDKYIHPNVHIMTKSCRNRYLNSRLPCSCPSGECWVSYARRCHKNGESALISEEWRKELENE